VRTFQKCGQRNRSKDCLARHSTFASAPDR
jgi:hypothetical protein